MQHFLAFGGVEDGTSDDVLAPQDLSMDPTLSPPITYESFGRGNGYWPYKGGVLMCVNRDGWSETGTCKHLSPHRLQSTVRENSRVIPDTEAQLSIFTLLEGQPWQLGGGSKATCKFPYFLTLVIFCMFGRERGQSQNNRNHATKWGMDCWT